MVEKNTIITYHIMQCFSLMFRMVTYLKTKDLLANLSIYRTKKKVAHATLSAEREGFEPPVPLSTSVFKTDAIDHSAISPKMKGILIFSIPFLYALRDSNPGPID